MSKKSKPEFAFAMVDSKGRINTYWMRPQAKMIRAEAPDGYASAKKNGYRIRKVRVILA